MNNIIEFPLDIRYRVGGINRDGRMIVEKLNSDEQFLMHAETIVRNSGLIRQFPKSQVEWLCAVVSHESGESRSHC